MHLFGSDVGRRAALLEGSNSMTTGTDLARVLARIDAMETSVRHLQNLISQIGRRLDHEAPRLHSTTFRSIESLLAVYRQLEPDTVMPPLSSPFGGWSITPDMARLMCELFAAKGPTRVLDVGSGSSTVLMGHLMKGRSGARLVSLEHDPIWYAQTLEMLYDAGLDEFVELRFAPLEKVELGSESFQWYSLEAIEDVEELDAVFVDGPPGHIGPRSRYPAGPLVVPKCRPGCLFIVDDTVREDDRQMVQQWRNEADMVLLEERVWHSKGASVLRVGPAGDEADG